MKSKYKTGSTLFFEGNDIDYVIFCDTEEERKELISHYRRTKEACLHFRLADKPTPIILGCYSNPYLELIEGEEIPALKEFNILEHKEEYKRTAMSYINYLKDTDKQWYHIYIACKMFERNKITLTKEMKTVAKKIHDNGISEDLKSYCIDVLTSIQ